MGNFTLFDYTTGKQLLNGLYFFGMLAVLPVFLAAADPLASELQSSLIRNSMGAIPLFIWIVIRILTGYKTASLLVVVLTAIYLLFWMSTLTAWSQLLVNILCIHALYTIDQETRLTTRGSHGPNSSSYYWIPVAFATGIFS